MTPITAAKRAGLDWKTLSKEERDIVTKVTRMMTAHYEQKLSDVRAKMIFYG